MNTISVVTFWIMTVLMWIQGASTIYMFAINPKQLNNVRTAGWISGALYITLAVLSTLIMIGLI